MSEKINTIAPFDVPRVGIGVMILREGKVLLGARKGSHGAGDYSFPGGHFDHGESFEECARREIAEECGPDFKVGPMRFLCLANIKAYLPKHYVQIGLVCDWVSGEAVNMEPNKLDHWDWYDFDKLPTPIFNPAEVMFEAHRTGLNYRDE